MRSPRLMVMSRGKRSQRPEEVAREGQRERGEENEERGENEPLGMIQSQRRREGVFCPVLQYLRRRRIRYLSDGGLKEEGIEKETRRTSSSTP